MGQNTGRGAVKVAVRDLRSFGEGLRVEQGFTEFSLWISPAYKCWTTLFELGERVCVFTNWHLDSEGKVR